MGEFRLKMLCSCCIELKELCLCSAPAPLVCGIVGIKIGFVPDFPIFNIKIKTVSPAFSIVSYNVLANFSPFLKIFRGESRVLLYMMLNRLAKAEIRLRSCVESGENRFVCTSEIVGCGIVYVGIEVAENVGDSTNLPPPNVPATS